MSAFWQFLEFHNIDVVIYCLLAWLALVLITARFCGLNEKRERDYWLLRQERVREMKR